MNTARDEKASRKKPRDGKAERDVGAALKSAYDRALHEDIPQEMLDLLGKLD